MAINPNLIQGLIDFAKRAPSAATVLFLIGAYIACGYIYTNYARADDLTELKTKVAKLTDELQAVKGNITAGRIENLQGQLFSARVDQCRASSKELKELYGKRVSNMQAQYRSLTGYAMDLPECDEL